MAADGMAHAAAMGLVAEALGERPPLLVEPADPDRTVARLRDALAQDGRFFVSGVLRPFVRRLADRVFSLAPSARA